jgi:hypothetical protein
MPSHRRGRHNGQTRGHVPGDLPVSALPGRWLESHQDVISLLVARQLGVLVAT